MSRKLFTTILIGITLVCVGLVFNKSPVRAATNSLCVGSAFGVNYCQGYFKGNENLSYVPIDNVLTNGLYDYSVAQLESTVGCDLNYGNSACSTTSYSIQNQMGAAFIIDTMLGQQAFKNAGLNQYDIVTPAQQNFPLWESRVQNIANEQAAGVPGWSINWNFLENSGLDSTYFPNLNLDDAFHGWDAAYDNGDAILFTFPGGSYSLGQACGNVQGTAIPLPQPQSNFTCTLTANELSGLEYQLTAKATVQNVNITSYNFSFGDGSNQAVNTTNLSATADHTYASTGTTYNATVTVYGNLGDGSNLSASCGTTVQTPVSTACNGSPDTLQVCCVNSGSSASNSAYYEASGGYYGPAPSTPNQVPGTSVSYSYQLSPGPPTLQTFSDVRLPTSVSPYTSQNINWTASYTYQEEIPVPITPTPTAPPYYEPFPANYNTQTSGGTLASYSTVTSVPCVTMSCNYGTVTPSLSPDPQDSYMPFTVSVNVANNYGMTPNGSMQLQIIPTDGGSYSNFSSLPTYESSGSNTLTSFNLGPTYSTGTYQYTWSLSGPGVPQADNSPCTGSFQVVNLPYLQVFGGDVMAGTSPSYNSVVSTCQAPDASAGVFSWNGLSSDSYAGAGTQYAVEALAQIDGFASAQASTTPTGLSFSNTTRVSPSSGDFGGYFGAAADDCDFTSDISTPPLVGNQTLSGILPNGVKQSDIPDGQQGQITVYVKGNVYISSKITYDTSGWSSPSDIPYFKLIVVGGNIYISPSVTELDGLYVAEPDSTGGGTIYTCATANGVPASINSSSYYSTCNSKLTVYGSFVANQVQFLRTYGSVGEARPGATVTSSSAAEVFDYTPELWLPRGPSLPNSSYDAITGLPPVL